MTDRTQLGAAIRERRKELRLTQAELAERAGVHPQTVVKYEAGAIGISIPNLRALATALETSDTALLGGAVPNDAPNETAAGAAAGVPAPYAVPPLAPQWEQSPTFWYGVQWALRGMMGRITELQDAVLAHGAAPGVGVSGTAERLAASPGEGRVPPGGAPYDPRPLDEVPPERRAPGDFSRHPTQRPMDMGSPQPTARPAVGAPRRRAGGGKG